MSEVDIRNEPCIVITDTYDRKTGRHLSTTCKTQDGRLVWEEGPNPNKNIVFFPDLEVLPEFGDRPQ